MSIILHHIVSYHFLYCITSCHIASNFILCMISYDVLCITCYKIHPSYAAIHHLKLQIEGMMSYRTTLRRIISYHVKSYYILIMLRRIVSCFCTLFRVTQIAFIIISRIPTFFINTTNIIIDAILIFILISIFISISNSISMYMYMYTICYLLVDKPRLSLTFQERAYLKA